MSNVRSESISFVRFGSLGSASMEFSWEIDFSVRLRLVPVHPVKFCAFDLAAFKCGVVFNVLVVCFSPRYFGSVLCLIFMF